MTHMNATPQVSQSSQRCLAIAVGHCKDGKSKKKPMAEPVFLGLA